MMDLDDPPANPTPPSNRSGSYSESNTTEMEAAWTNCSRQTRVEDVSDQDDLDSDSSESMNLDSDTNLFSDDNEDSDSEERTRQHDFGDLDLGFQLRAA